MNSPADPIRTHQRRTTAARRVGIGARCACGESRPEALITGSKPMVCAECKRKKEGKKSMDQHHVAGKANSAVTISVPANDHRAILSTDQYDWPKKTLENSDGSPLLAIAACLRGFISSLKYLIESLLEKLPEFVEKLDQILTHHFGPQWWTRFDFNINNKNNTKENDHA